MEERKDKNKKDSHNHGQEDKILFKYPDGYRKSLILFQKQAPFFFYRARDNTENLCVVRISRTNTHFCVYLIIIQSTTIQKELYCLLINE